MKRRIAMFLAAAGVAVTVGMFSPAPAQAQNVCAGNGTAQLLTAAFTYPGLSQARTSTFTATLNGLCAPSLAASLTAGGTVTGWCGLSVGTGTSPTSFRWVGVGSFLVLTGGVTALVNATPNALANESCATGADNFLIAGAGVVLPCTVVAHSQLTTVTFPPSLNTVGPVSVHTGGSLNPHVTVCV